MSHGPVSKDVSIHKLASSKNVKVAPAAYMDCCFRFYGRSRCLILGPRRGTSAIFVHEVRIYINPRCVPTLPGSYNMVSVRLCEAGMVVPDDKFMPYSP